jgi:hypothetical protein
MSKRGLLRLAYQRVEPAQKKKKRPIEKKKKRPIETSVPESRTSEPGAACTRVGDSAVARSACGANSRTAGARNVAMAVTCVWVWVWVCVWVCVCVRARVRECE